MRIWLVLSTFLSCFQMLVFYENTCSTFSKALYTYIVKMYLLDETPGVFIKTDIHIWGVYFPQFRIQKINKIPHQFLYIHCFHIDLQFTWIFSD